MQVVRAVGGRAPLHLTSVGKLFLAAGRPAARARLCHPHGPVGPHPQQHHRAGTPGARARGACGPAACARDDEELELGVRCMAAGIFDDQGKLVAGLSISRRHDRLAGAGWRSLPGHWRRSISAALGYRPGSRAKEARSVARAATGRLRPGRQLPFATRRRSALGVTDAGVSRPARVEERP
jgi:DNA-binding IclR family transcriptional regulator